MIEAKHPSLSVKRQCELLELPRSTYYHRPEPESDENLALMRIIDETYLAFPFFGSRQMTRWLRRQGRRVNRKRVRRLMAAMGMEAIYRRANLSKAAKAHPVYPYLLRELAVTRSNQVWATDITYIPVAGGFVYLCAVIDWHSRYVLAWELSNTLDAAFCACGRCNGRSRRMACRRSSTPTKAASLPAPSLPSRCLPSACACRWTARAGAWTTSSSSGCGEASNTRRST